MGSPGNHSRWPVLQPVRHGGLRGRLRVAPVPARVGCRGTVIRSQPCSHLLWHAVLQGASGSLQAQDTKPALRYALRATARGGRRSRSPLRPFSSSGSGKAWPFGSVEGTAIHNRPRRHGWLERISAAVAEFARLWCRSSHLGIVML